MSAGAEWPVIEKGALFERLARGRSAGVTVVTPNKRLSQALMLEFDAFQIGKAVSVWEAPDILPFGAFVQRLYEDGLYADLSAEPPMLLTPAPGTRTPRLSRSGSPTTRRKPRTTSTPRGCRMRCGGSCRSRSGRSSLS